VWRSGDAHPCSAPARKPATCGPRMSAACTVRMTAEELAPRGQRGDVTAAPARPRADAVTRHGRVPRPVESLSCCQQRRLGVRHNNRPNVGPEWPSSNPHHPIKTRVVYPADTREACCPRRPIIRVRFVPRQCCVGLATPVRSFLLREQHLSYALSQDAQEWAASRSCHLFEVGAPDHDFAAASALVS